MKKESSIIFAKFNSCFLPSVLSWDLIRISISPLTSRSQSVSRAAPRLVHWILATLTLGVGILKDFDILPISDTDLACPHSIMTSH